MTIDGYSQGKSTKNMTADDANPNTLATGTNAKLKIELTGEGLSPSTPNAIGLACFAPNCVVKGLAINGFVCEGILLTTNSANSSVEDSFIGTDATTGTQALSNGGGGVEIAPLTSNNILEDLTCRVQPHLR